MRECLEDLLQLPDADVLAGKEGRKGGKVGLAVVVRDENLGSDGLGGGDTLVHGHRKWLVHSGESGGALSHRNKGVTLRRNFHNTAGPESPAV